MGVIYKRRCVCCGGEMIVATSMFPYSRCERCQATGAYSLHSDGTVTTPTPHPMCEYGRKSIEKYLAAARSSSPIPSDRSQR